MEPTVTKTKGTERVERYVARHLRAAESGTALPSFRKISRECHVAPNTVGNAIRRLEAEGLLEVRDRSGVYAPSDTTGEWRGTTALRQVSFVFMGADPTNPADPTTSEFRKELIACLKKESGRRGQNACFHSIDESPAGIPQMRALAGRSDCEACILCHLTSLDAVAVLRDAQIPYVCLYPESPEVPESNCVLIDAERIVELQFDYLLSLGHRRIGYLHDVDPGHYHRGRHVRRETFYRLALDHELPVTSALVQSGGYGRPEDTAGIRALLAEDAPPTALICNDAHLPNLYRVAQDLGMEIGRGLGVVGTNDGPEASVVDPPASTVRVPRQAAVVAALELLDQAARTPDNAVANHFVDARLVDRESASRAPSRSDN